MTSDKVEAVLREYKAAVGRSAYLEIVIGRMEEEYNAAKAIEAQEDVLQGVALDGMPRSPMPADTVESTALRHIGGHLPDFIRELGIEIARLKDEKKDCDTTIRMVDAWMAGLQERDRVVLVAHCIEGMYWREVEAHYQKTFGERCSKEGLKWIKRRAIANIIEMSDWR
jgi:hypothetical protein